MPRKTWILTDTADGIFSPQFQITPDDLPGSTGAWSVTKRLLQGGLSDGMEMVEVDNGRMRLMLLPTRGMGVWKAELSESETLGWRSPVRGPVHPKFVPVSEPSGLGWLDGFDELVVRCGLDSNGAPAFDDLGRLQYPLHGQIANRPAHYLEVTVDDSARTITVRGMIDECRFHFQKLRLTASITTSFDSTSFTINDDVINFGGTPAIMQMLYHINVGEPLLKSGARIVAPIRALAPHDQAATAHVDSWDRVGPPVAGAPEQCFFFDLLAEKNGETQVLIKNLESNAGASVQFNTQMLPHFTVWKNMVARADGYVTGLEPATNFPNGRPFEQEKGRVVELAPDQSWSGQVVVDWMTTATEVEAAEAAVIRLQETAQGTVHSKPLSDWSDGTS